ncbi:MAG: hypothetical protein IT303_18040 [Dehalococcoidia bacterium]|nr:hypothetical protein [Dehalococcoidia bacterium]
MSRNPNYWQRRSISRRKFVYGSGVTAAGLLASVACGGGDDDDDDNSTGDSSTPSQDRSTPTPLPVQTSTAKTGGTLQLIWNTADAQLDPHSTTEHLSPELYRAVSHGLMKQKSVTEEPEFDLATKLEKPDPLTLIFHLNPAAKWQNKAPVNGRAVTVDDVI